MNNLEEQKEELFSVESIFNGNERNFIVEDKGPPRGYFKANVRMPEQFCVTYKVENLRNSENPTSDSEIGNTESFVVEHLPPINLFFELSESYPSDTYPAFLLTCNWLNLQQLTLLCKHLESMWSKDMPVLYTWCQFLESDVVEFLGLDKGMDITELLMLKVINNFRNGSFSSSIASESGIGGVSNDQKGQSLFDDCSNASDIAIATIKPGISGGSGPYDLRAFNDLNDGKYLIETLKNYNEFKTREIFNQRYHECDVCLTSKVGADFVNFRACNHAFCKECLKSFFEVHIRDGNVNCLGCPKEKCKTQADGSMVRQIVEKDLFERYDKILLSRTLETMSDITNCPRKGCQRAVILDPGDPMGICASCTYVFCPFCRMAYHGIAPCSLKSQERQLLCDRYLGGDAEMKELMDRRYGRRNLKLLVEDCLSESWKNTNSKSCPQCKSSIEKTDGCNKMTCFSCGTFFCWICMEQLESSNPYDHYSRQNARCILFPEDDMMNFIDIGPIDFLQFL